MRTHKLPYVPLIVPAGGDVAEFRDTGKYGSFRVAVGPGDFTVYADCMFSCVAMVSDHVGVLGKTMVVVETAVVLRDLLAVLLSTMGCFDVSVVVGVVVGVVVSVVVSDVVGVVVSVVVSDVVGIVVGVVVGVVVGRVVAGGGATKGMKEVPLQKSSSPKAMAALYAVLAVCCTPHPIPNISSDKF